MLETCLENKVIYDFLSYYEKTCWQKLIPSLLEIAILNLKSSFKTLFFSEEDIHNIIKDLKIKQKIDSIPNTTKKSKFNFSKPLVVWRTREKDDLENFRYSQSFRKKEEKILNKRLISSVKNKIIDKFDFDKNNSYNNSNYIDNKLSQTYNQREKINYAISYDKDLNPEIIERTMVKKNKNKKGGKKIIQKMTQEEYEQQYSEENQDNNEIYYEENEDNDNQKEKNIQKIVNNKSLNNKKNFNIINKRKKENKNKPKKNDLYHYKNNYNNQNNINFINNNRNNLNYNNQNKINTNINQILNSQNGFNNQLIKNNLINAQYKNNYINIENNENDEIDNMNDQNNLKKNVYTQIAPSIKDSGKTTELIGIEKKYKNKIDELEKNILIKNPENNIIKNINNKNNNFDFNKNNIENYADKLKVNITNMEDYKMQKSKNKNNNIDQNHNLEINIINNDDEEVNNEVGEEEIEEEENEQNENNLNDNEEGEYLSQMSNMTEKGKFLFKKAMDECPFTEEENLEVENIEQN